MNTITLKVLKWKALIGYELNEDSSLKNWKIEKVIVGKNENNPDFLIKKLTEEDHKKIEGDIMNAINNPSTADEHSVGESAPEEIRVEIPADVEVAVSETVPEEVQEPVTGKINLVTGTWEFTINDKDSETWVTRFMKDGGKIFLGGDFDFEKTYAKGNGKYQNVLNALMVKIGKKVDHGRTKNQNLFVLNNAFPVYHELISSDGMKVHDRMWWIFGISKTDPRFTSLQASAGKRGRAKNIYDVTKCLPAVEQMMDALILLTAKEQGINIEEASEGPKVPEEAIVEETSSEETVAA